MPRKLERHELLHDLEFLLEIQAYVESSDESDMSSDDDSESSNDSSSDEDELMDLYKCIQVSWYMERGLRISKSTDFKDQYFADLPPASFRQLTRMDRISFAALVDLISDHPIFKNKARLQQAPVSLQLVVALDRFGHDGNSACLNRSLYLWGIGKDSMVNYTHRVMVALLSRLRYYLTWSCPHRRAAISKEFAQKGFPGCVGLVDGTLLSLSQRPKEHSKTYFDRKGNYSINAQVVCDHRRRILFLFAGMTCSCVDITCLKRSLLWAHLETRGYYFDDHQYILGDSGYSPLLHLLPSFKMASRDIEKQDFNTCVAHARVTNKHCIGILKVRWHSLKQLSVLQYSKEAEVEGVFLSLLSCAAPSYGENELKQKRYQVYRALALCLGYKDKAQLSEILATAV